jgi:hypothetical protein
MLKKFLISLLAVFVWLSTCRADEGMWIPLLLKNNEARMKSMGMKLSAEDIYNINGSSIKNAIVLFGRGCTGEIISPEGLLLTNHHCGFGQIQNHSTLENDYLKDGFWAMNRKEELVNKGLTVSFLVRMDDVTTLVLNGIDDNLSQAQREELIEKNIKQICADAVAGSHYQAAIKDFYKGNQYFIFITEVFRDVRLVGAPPSSIGKFGGDTDNWMWPRHTGDFSLFRVYAGPDNLPADYSPDNVPYRPSHVFPMSIKGVEPGDFTFVYGFPGSTNQFATSFEVELIKELENPIAIELRTLRLDIIDKYSKNDPLIKIQYAAKHANIANGWKKWIGENKGLQRLNTIQNKRNFEQQFQSWAAKSPETEQKYGKLMTEYKNIYSEQFQTRKAYKYFVEAGIGSEIMTFAWRFNNLVQTAKKTPDNTKDIEKYLAQVKATAEGFFKDFNVNVDKELFIYTMKAYYDSFEAKDIPQALDKSVKKYKGDFAKFADDLYAKSILSKQNELNKFLASFSPKQYKKIENDPIFILSASLFNNYFDNIYPNLVKYDGKLDSLGRIYMQGLFDMQTEKNFYPDANLTLRVTYGKVDGYTPRDAVTYKHQTTLDGIFDKETLGYDDYVVPEKLRELYKNKDFGRYGVNGTMPVCFIASNHTTGGNSGSPVLNAQGHLVGINFDRNWEGTMSDLNYDPDQCRNISLDMRYVLFIIDKYAGATHLIEEIEIFE